MGLIPGVHIPVVDDLVDRGTAAVEGAVNGAISGLTGGGEKPAAAGGAGGGGGAPPTDGLDPKTKGQNDELIKKMTAQQNENFRVTMAVNEQTMKHQTQKTIAEGIKP